MSKRFAFVMAGLDPAIHADGQCGGKPWMPGTGPRMTAREYLDELP